jgi:hypothetical protein
MSHSLLVYAMLPESVSFYAIPDEVANQYRELLKAAHNKMVNMDEDGENAGTDFLIAALCEEKNKDDESYFNKSTPPEHKCVFAKYKVDISQQPIADKDFTVVYYSGFLL